MADDDWLQSAVDQRIRDLRFFLRVLGAVIVLYAAAFVFAVVLIFGWWG